MRQWILAAALAGAAHGAAGEVPDRTVDIADWVVNRATCGELLDLVRNNEGAKTPADLELPRARAFMFWVAFMEGFADGAGITRDDAMLHMFNRCTRSSDKHLLDALNN